MVAGTSIFVRQTPEGCVENCPTPSCNCPGNQDCQLVAQTCDRCSQTTCVPNPSSATSPGSIGAIAGGLFGGLAVAGIIGTIVYIRCIKKKKARMSMAVSAAEKENDFGMLKSARVNVANLPNVQECTNYCLGLDPYRCFNCVYCSYPCIKCYSDCVHPWRHQPFRSPNAISLGPTCPAASRDVWFSFFSYITVSSVSFGWRFPILGRRYPARFHVHCQ